MDKVNLQQSSEIKNIIQENQLKNIVIKTGDENVYIPHENKFIVTKDFVSNINDLFYKCLSLKQINMSNLDFSSIVSMYQWFTSCRNLQEIIFPEIADCSNLLTLYNCFADTNIQEINLSFMQCLNKNKFLDFEETFCYAKAKKIILPKCNIASMINCFDSCENVKEIIAPITLLTLIDEEDLSEIFLNCEKLQKIDFSEGQIYIKKTNKPTSYNNLPENCVIILP